MVECVFPEADNVTDTEIQRLCATYVKEQLDTISGPDSPTLTGIIMTERLQMSSRVKQNST